MSFGFLDRDCALLSVEETCSTWMGALGTCVLEALDTVGLEKAVFSLSKTEKMTCCFGYHFTRVSQIGPLRQ